MSLTAFNRIRRMQQVEEMKPENIIKEQEEKAPIEKPVEEAPVVEEVKSEIVAEPKVEEVKPVTRTANRRKSNK